MAVTKLMSAPSRSVTDEHGWLSLQFWLDAHWPGRSVSTERGLDRGQVIKFIDDLDVCHADVVCIYAKDMIDGGRLITSLVF